jgi:translocation and assembly module TamA
MRAERWLQSLLAVLLCLCVNAARADITMTITGIEGPPRDNIELMLSITRFRKDDSIDADTAQRLGNRIDDEVKTALKHYGYYDPEVKYDFRPEGNNWHYSIHVESGAPKIIRNVNIRVTGPGADDAAFAGIRTQTLIQPGMQLNDGMYELVKGEMTRAAAANGYLGAQLLERYIDVDPKSPAADISLHLETGEQYRFGAIDIDQEVIRPGLMRRFLRFKEGDPYSAFALLNTQYALDDSLYFSTVEVSPDDPDDATRTVRIRITAEKSRWQLSLGGGYGTDTGVRGTLGWTDTQLNDRGHRLRFELKASASTRRVDARYDIPIGDPALERFSVEFLNKFEDIGDLETNETTLRPSVTRMHNRWQSVTSLSITNTSTEEGGERSSSNLLVPGIELSFVPEGYRGEALFNRNFSAELIGSHSALGSDADFLRLNLRMERNFDLSKQWHLLLRGEFGTSLVSEFSEVPGIYRFFAGGDQSVRGFGYKSLSPEEPDPRDPTKTIKTGGRHVIVGSVEIVRDLPKNLAAAAFFDFGNAFNSFKDPIEYAAGVGVRYRLEIASIGIDVAKPLSTSGNIRYHLNFTVSQ